MTHIELRRTSHGWWRYRIGRYWRATGCKTAMGALTRALSEESVT